MYNKYMPAKKSYTLYTLHLPLVALLIAFFVAVTYSSYFISSQSDGLGSVLGKDDNKGQGKKEAAKANALEKAQKENASGKDKANTTSINAELHRKNIGNVVTTLEEVALEESDVGNEEVSEDIEEVATEQEESVDEVAEAIETVEGRPKWQTLLIGTDYKNLGKLRSALAHNQNAIRKLTKSSDEIVSEDGSVVVNEQLATLYEEQVRIADVIQSAESEFSLLGWVVRFFTGYDPVEIVDEVDETTDPVENDVEETTLL